VKHVSAGTYEVVGKFQAHVRGDKANSAIIKRILKDARKNEQLHVEENDS